MEINDIALPVGISLKNRYYLSEIYYIGPMSIVYMGHDRHTGNQVVIKEFCPYKLSNRDKRALYVKVTHVRRSLDSTYRAFNRNVKL